MRAVDEKHIAGIERAGELAWLGFEHRAAIDGVGDALDLAPRHGIDAGDVQIETRIARGAAHDMRGVAAADLDHAFRAQILDHRISRFRVAAGEEAIGGERAEAAACLLHRRCQPREQGLDCGPGCFEASLHRSEDVFGRPRLQHVVRADRHQQIGPRAGREFADGMQARFETEIGK